MYPVIYLNCDLKARHNNLNLLTRVKDRFSINFIKRSTVKELGVEISVFRFPPNFNLKAYNINMEHVRKKIHRKKAVIAPRTLRTYDYRMFNNFQKSLLGYSVIKSIQLLLRVNKKSINNSCIVVSDALHEINLNVLKELAKHARYIVLLSHNVMSLKPLRDKITSDYGVTPVITNDMEFALKEADFIISSGTANIDCGKPVWYIDNGIEPLNINNMLINDVLYKVPWDTEYSNMTVELLGAILSQMQEKDVERALNYNGIYLDKILFNKSLVKIQV